MSGFILAVSRDSVVTTAGGSNKLPLLVIWGGQSAQPRSCGIRSVASPHYREIRLKLPRQGGSRCRGSWHSTSIVLMTQNTTLQMCYIFRILVGTKLVLLNVHFLKYCWWHEVIWISYEQEEHSGQYRHRQGWFDFCVWWRRHADVQLHVVGHGGRKCNGVICFQIISRASGAWGANGDLI